VGAPALRIRVGQLVDFRPAGGGGELLRLLEGLGIPGLAALAWSAAGQHLPAWALALLSVIHALLHPLGERLLKA
jgi:hypothetical protein